MSTAGQMEEGEIQHFSITKELSLSSDIKIACWCPTMDLCAVVSTDGQLHLHRMDWQQLWAISLESLITAVCWRPDGKELAAGHANGAISLLDVETGDVIAAHKVHYAGIATLSWSDQADGSTPSPLGSSQQQLFGPQHSVAPHQRFKRLFAPPILEPLPLNSAEALPNPYDFSSEAAGAPAWPQQQERLSLLTAADVRGVVSIWLQGQVQIAEVAGGSIDSSIFSGSSSAQTEEGCEDKELYKLLNAVPSSHLEQLLTVHSSSTGSVLLVSRSLQLLHQCQEPLLQCTALFSQLQTLLRAAVKCVDSCAQDWNSTMSDFKKRFDTQLRQELADQGSTVTVPQQELLLLLATGSTTPPLQSFLASTLGEAGLRRLARTVDSTASGLHTALLERVMPLVELVLFLLGELRGLVMCGGGGEVAAGSWMGLQVELLQQLEINAAALLLRTEQLRRAATTITCQHRAFFTWLLNTIKLLEGQDPNQEDNANNGGSSSSMSLPMCQDVLAFLKGQFVHDLVGPELAGGTLSKDAKLRAETLFYQGILPAETHKLLALLLPCCPSVTPNPNLQGLAKPSSGAAANPYSLPNSPVTAALKSPIQQQQQQQHIQQQQQQQGQEVCSQERIEKAAAACSRGLAQQLKHLASLCEEAFEQPLSVISPSITPSAQLLLLPPAADSSSSSSSSPLVVVGPPLLQPKACVDRNIYICCRAPPPAAAAAAAGNQQHQQLLLLVRVPPESFQQQQQQQHEEGPKPALQADGVLLQLPEGHEAAAWAFYQQDQMALLQQNAGSGILHLLQLADAPWVRLEQQSQAPDNGVSALEQCLQQRASVPISDLSGRSRRLQHGVTGQLAVSRSRGLAGLVTDMQHLLLMDLEEDEEQDDDGEDQEADDADNMEEE